MKPIYFLDANVSIYAAGSDPIYQQPCERILRAVSEGQLRAVVSAEVMQEIMHFGVRRGRLPAAAVLVARIMNMMEAVLPVERRNVTEMVEILQSVPGLRTRDAMHAAVMRRHGIEAIITADRHFSLIPGLTVLDPVTAATMLGA